MLQSYIKTAAVRVSDTNYLFRPVVKTKDGHRFKNV